MKGVHTLIVKPGGEAGGGGGGGRKGSSYNGIIIGMCRSMGVLRVKKFWLVGFQNGKIRGKKKKIVTEPTVALLI